LSEVNISTPPSVVPTPVPDAVAANVVDEATPESETPPTMESPELPCQADHWDLIPIGVYEFLESDGWKIVVIRFAVHNGSNLWGELEIRTNPNYYRNVLETEDGYVYELYQRTSNTVYLPDEPSGNPYSGAVHVPNKINTAIGRQPYTVFVPPGFTVVGNLGGAGSDLGGHPSPGINSLYQLLFKVPQAQQEYTLTLSGGIVRCIDEEGSRAYGPLPPQPLDISTGVQQLTYPQNVMISQPLLK